ncbi:MAG: hypothetical protein IPF57_24750 [Gammaproteobacteria bacterium]|nr:hypothetical protein [Gammaproteobacteria bacterium]
MDAEVPEGAQGDVGNVINAITAQRNGASFVFNQTLTGINNPNALAAPRSRRRRVRSSLARPTPGHWSRPISRVARWR